MSGGHWEYVGFRLRDGLESMGGDEQLIARMPHLAKALFDLGEALYAIEH